MAKANCFKETKSLIDETTSRLGYQWSIDSERLRALKEYCDMIESVADLYDGVAYEIEINENTTDITVSLVCEAFETDQHSSKFYEVVKHAKQVEFSAYDTEISVKISFTFDGVWTRRIIGR